MQKTTVRHNKDITAKWYIVDATDQVLGRLATKVADLLRGKLKADFTPHVTSGDYVIVINAEKIKLTGTKWNSKLYRRHSGYMGHLKEWNARKQLETDPTFIIRHAVSGMLRRNRLRTTVLSRLKVVTGVAHAHEAQQPETVSLN